MSGLIQIIGSDGGTWLAEDGPEAGVVFSSRVRLARNLAGMLFASKAAPGEQKTVVEAVKSGVQKCPSLGQLTFIDFSRLNKREKRFLMEGYCISREMAAGDGKRALFLSSDRRLSVMINEEDHIRVQSILPGFQLREAWQQINTVDDELGQRVDFAFSDKWGFLTACPTNVGTGLRASVMVHLPALIMTRKIASAVQTVSRLGCAVRGIHGEGTDIAGDFFQISNQATLGQDEEGLVGNVQRIASELVAQEKRARGVLLERHRMQVEDRVGRALGILGRARMLGLEETMSLLSALRLGVCLGLASHYPIPLINQLMIRVQPAHLELSSGREIEPGTLDGIRADIVKEALSRS
jgi:protein arginine kinase